MSYKPPVLPSPPVEYTRGYMDELLKSLNLFFRANSGTQDLRATTLHIDLKTMPTEADISDIRKGDVYVDTSAGNVLKVKV